MKTYSLTTTLTGVLSDDYLYFEGTARPQVVRLLFDNEERPSENLSKEMRLELEGYWNDVYNLFLRKLTYCASSAELKDEEAVKLQALLQELIKVRKLIVNASRADIMGE